VAFVRALYDRVYGTDACVPKHGDGQGILEIVRRSRRVGLVVFSDREERGEGEIRRYKLSLGGNWYWLSVTTSNDGKIAQIYW